MHSDLLIQQLHCQTWQQQEVVVARGKRVCDGSTGSQENLGKKRKPTLKLCSAPVQISIDPQMQRAQENDCCFSSQRSGTAPGFCRASAPAADGTAPEDQCSPAACRKNIGQFGNFDDFHSGITPRLGAQGSRHYY